MKTLYIAYGSNLDKSQMQYRCPTAIPVAVSTLPNYRLVFQGHAYGAHANVIPEEGREVPVAIWEIGPIDEAALDRYEGVAGGYYTKEYMTIDVNGEPQEALIYIMAPNPYGNPTIQYLETIARGYRDFNLPIKVLNDAVRETVERTKSPRRAGR